MSSGKPLFRRARCLPFQLLVAAGLLLLSKNIRAQPVQTVQSTQLVQLPDVNTLNPPPARVPIFYPPDPPAPGAAIDRVSLLQLPQWDAPAEIAPFAGELFYPLLATRIAEKESSKKLLERVKRYREQRERLAAELRAALRAGAAFASTTALTALETEAEKLCEDLMLPEFHWNRYRQWSPTKAADKEERNLLIARQYHFLRASVFYRDGLSTAQRRLLRDFVLWFVRFTTPATEVTVAPVAAGAVVSFFPLPSFIRLPDKIPQDVASDLQALLRAKHELQKELVATLLATDQDSGPSRRRALEALATRQQPQIDALEQQAEVLRPRLVALPDPSPSPLPDVVVELGRGYMRMRSELEQELIARLIAARREHCRYKSGSETLVWKSNFASGGYVSIDAFRTPQELFAIVDQTHAQSARSAATATALKNARSGFKSDTAARQKELETLRARYLVGTLAALFPDQPLDQKFPPDLLAHTARRLQLDEIRQRTAEQSDYVTATLRPGLTPAERRLLLNQALADMALPLPPGVRRPVYRLDGP